MRPLGLSEFVGQEHLLGPGKLLNQMIAAHTLHSMVLWGPPGSGKTTLAHLLAHESGANFIWFSAVICGIAELRDAAEAAREADPAGQSRVGRYQTVIRMIDAMSTDLMTHMAAELERLGIRSVDDVRRAGRALASFSPPMALKVEELKQIMRERLYRQSRVSRMTEKAGRVLVRLFETYMAEPRQMPEHILARAERDGEPIPRVVADYIAGMTDRFALDEYRKLFDPDERV